MADWNICEHCSVYVGLGTRDCPECRWPLVLDARGKLAIWRLGDIPDGIIGPLASRLRKALGIEVVLQPGYLDERPSHRPEWSGASANVFLDQVDRRHALGAGLSLGVTAGNITPSKAYNFVFGLGYLERGSCVFSLHQLEHDDRDTFVERAFKIALHELGHATGLGHHAYDDGANCAMVGDVEIDDVDELDASPAAFCRGCRKVVRERIGAVGR